MDSLAALARITERLTTPPLCGAQVTVEALSELLPAVQVDLLDMPALVLSQQPFCEDLVSARRQALLTALHGGGLFVPFLGNVSRRDAGRPWRWLRLSGATFGNALGEAAKGVAGVFDAPMISWMVPCAEMCDDDRCRQAAQCGADAACPGDAGPAGLSSASAR